MAVAHLWQSLIRGCAADRALVGWLDACIFPLFAHTICAADGYAGVRLSILDLISTGVTTVVDFSHAFSAEFVRGNVRALDASGLRFAFCYFGTDDEAMIQDIAGSSTSWSPRTRARASKSHPACGRAGRRGRQPATGIERLREAVTVLGTSPDRLELARALTDLGAALRRSGQRRAAREQLRAGLDLAHRCGGLVLTERAPRELTVTGARPVAPHRPGWRR